MRSRTFAALLAVPVLVAVACGPVFGGDPCRDLTPLPLTSFTGMSMGWSQGPSVESAAANGVVKTATLDMGTNTLKIEYTDHRGAVVETWSVGPAEPTY